MKNQHGTRWNIDGRHAWLVYESAEETRTVLQDTRNDRAWLDSSVSMSVTQ